MWTKAKIYNKRTWARSVTIHPLVSPGGHQISRRAFRVSFFQGACICWCYINNRTYNGWPCIYYTERVSPLLSTIAPLCMEILEHDSKKNCRGLIFLTARCTFSCQASPTTFFHLIDQNKKDNERGKKSLEKETQPYFSYSVEFAVFE